MVSCTHVAAALLRQAPLAAVSRLFSCSSPERLDSEDSRIMGNKESRPAVAHEPARDSSEDDGRVLAARELERLLQYPELRFLDRYDALVPLLFALTLYGAGEALAHFAPALQTSGWQMGGWGLKGASVSAI